MTNHLHGHLTSCVFLSSVQRYNRLFGYVSVIRPLGHVKMGGMCVSGLAASSVPPREYPDLLTPNNGLLNLSQIRQKVWGEGGGKEWNEYGF